MNTKKCSRCDQTLDITKFGLNRKKKTGLQAYCKACSRAYRLKYYQANKEKQQAQNYAARDKARDLIKKSKDTPCADCGREYPSYVMDFDHRDPADKAFAIANMPRNGYTLSKIKEEIQKCDVVCANCHRIRTHSNVDKQHIEM